MFADLPLVRDDQSLLRRWKGAILLGATLFYGGALFAAGASGVDPTILIVDAADVAKSGSHVGLFSNIGILLWIATGAVTLYAGSVLTIDRYREWHRLLLAGGLLTLALAVDDFFLIHDTLIPQSVCYAVYALATLLILAKFRRAIFTFDGGLFLIAGGCLAGSILADLLQNRLPFDYSAVQIVEEGLKFVGVVAWSLFWLSAAYEKETR